MVGRRVAISLLLGRATILGWSTSGACNNSVAEETNRAAQEDAIRERSSEIRWMVGVVRETKWNRTQKIREINTSLSV